MPNPLQRLRANSPVVSDLGNLLNPLGRVKYVSQAKPGKLPEVSHAHEVEPATEEKWNSAQGALDRDAGIDGNAAPGTRHYLFDRHAAYDLDLSGRVFR